MGDAADTTSFVNSSSGSLIPTVAYTANRLKRVRFPTAIQPTDTIELQFKPNASYPTWTPAGGAVIDTGMTGYYLTYFDYANNAGVSISTVVNATDVDVVFGRYRLPGSADWAAQDTSMWRVVKFSNAVPAEVVSKTLARARRTTTAQTVATGTVAEIVLNEAINDANAEINTSTGRITPKKPGYYKFTLDLTINPNVASNGYEAWIYKNGAYSGGFTGTRLCYFAATITAGSEPTMNHSKTVVAYMNGTTDYVSAFILPGINSLTVDQGGGSAITFEGPF